MNKEQALDIHILGIVTNREATCIMAFKVIDENDKFRSVSYIYLN